MCLLRIFSETHSSKDFELSRPPMNSMLINAEVNLLVSIWLLYQQQLQQLTIPFHLALEAALRWFSHYFTGYCLSAAFVASFLIPRILNAGVSQSSHFSPLSARTSSVISVSLLATNFIYKLTFPKIISSALTSSMTSIFFNQPPYLTSWISNKHLQQHDQNQFLLSS